MSYLSDKGWGTKFPYDLIRVRVGRSEVFL